MDFVDFVVDGVGVVFFGECFGVCVVVFVDVVVFFYVYEECVDVLLDGVYCVFIFGCRLYVCVEYGVCFDYFVVGYEFVWFVCVVFGCYGVDVCVVVCVFVEVEFLWFFEFYFVGFFNCGRGWFGYGVYYYGCIVIVVMVVFGVCF